MTAVPKHWPSSRRQGRKRASNPKNHRRLPSLTTCQHCHAPKIPSFQCPNCQL